MDGNEQASVASIIGPSAAELCDSCIGRQFARLEPPEGNAARGARIRAVLLSAAPASCSLCEDLVARVPRFVELCLSAAADYEFSSFVVGSVTFDAIREREKILHEELLRRDTEGFAARFPPKPNSPAWSPGEWVKTEINREVGRRIEAATGKRVEFDRPEMTFRLDTRFDHVDVTPADLFARGRYQKFVRDLPQTRWPCRACQGLGCRQCGGKGKTYETSVEELVAAPVVAASLAEEEAFHGMGREDIDARTLGNGRPFILELKRPRRRSLPWAALENEINERHGRQVKVLSLAAAGFADAARYKAADPDKTYHAVCRAEQTVDRAALEASLAKLSGVALEQRTPQRVAHRRSDLVRRRTVQRLRLLDHAGERFTIEIRADSGTYIKEFVSGDEGRTVPSLAATLGMPMRVAELDVVDVDWQEETGVDAE